MVLSGVPRWYEHKRARLVFCWLETMHASLLTSLDAHEKGSFAVHWLWNPAALPLD